MNFTFKVIFLLAVIISLILITQPIPEEKTEISEETCCFDSKAHVERVTTDMGVVNKVHLKKGFHPLL